MARTESIRLTNNRGGVDMWNRFISRTSAVGMAVALISLTALPMAGQVTKSATKSALPRMPDGHPDLEGTYDLATMTPLERLPGHPPFLTKEKPESLENAEPHPTPKHPHPPPPPPPPPPP